MDGESSCAEGERGWLKKEERLLRKIPHHPSSNPNHKIFPEEFQTCAVLKITIVTTKTQTQLKSQFNPMH